MHSYWNLTKFFPVTLQDFRIGLGPKGYIERSKNEGVDTCRKPLKKVDLTRDQGVARVSIDLLEIRMVLAACSLEKKTYWHKPRFPILNLYPCCPEDT